LCTATWRRTNIVFKLPMGFVKDESGGTAMEYALIAALISVVIVGAVTTIGTTLTGFFQTVAAAI
jgi:pilus assembly protein Flp/PilA